MSKRPKISVIIPIYNVEAYLSRCIESVIGQTMLDIEIICVNDGTKDNSVDIVRRYMSFEPRIRLIEKENGGIASARNAGLRAATGDIIQFLDPDDYLDLNACETICKGFYSYQADIVVFGSTPFPDVPEIDEWITYKLTSRDTYYPEFHPDAMILEPCGLPFIWNKAFKREFLVQNHLEFDESIHFGEDMAFLFSSVPRAKGILFIEDPLHFYQCFRKDSLMDNYRDDNVRKLAYHVHNMEIITRGWYEQGWFKQWGSEFFEWFVDFLVPDLMEYRPSNTKELATQALDILKRYDVLRYRRTARIRCQIKYWKLCTMAK